MKLQFEIDREEDGRFIVEIPELPGVMAYGRTQSEAIDAVVALAFRVLAEKLENGELRRGGAEDASLELPLIPA